MAFSPESRESFIPSRGSEDPVQADKPPVISEVFMQTQAEVLMALFDGDETKIVKWLDENKENGELLREVLTKQLKEYGNIDDIKGFSESIREIIFNKDTQH